MKKKRISIFLISFTLALSGVMAEDGVCVEKTDGTKQVFLFSETPKITYSNDNLVMTTFNTSTTFPISEVSRFYFEESNMPSGVVGLMEDDEQQPLIRVTETVAEFYGFNANTPVNLFDKMGRLLARDKTANDGTLSISLSDFPKGIYIIKAEKITIKIQKQ